MVIHSTMRHSSKCNKSNSRINKYFTALSLKHCICSYKLQLLLSIWFKEAGCVMVHHYRVQVSKVAVDKTAAQGMVKPPSDQP